MFLLTIERMDFLCLNSFILSLCNIFSNGVVRKNLQQVKQEIKSITNHWRDDNL